MSRRLRAFPELAAPWQKPDIHIASERCMQCVERRNGDVTIVDVSGRLRRDDGVNEFRALFSRLFDQGQTRIVLNMAGCSYLDSAGLGELATAHVKAHDAGGNLVLLNLPERLQEVLRVTRMLGSFTVRDDEPSAVAAAQGTDDDARQV